VHIKPSPSGVDVLEDVALTRPRIALFPCHRYPNAIAAAGPKLRPPISMAATASPPTTKPILAIRVIVLSAHQRDCVKVDINASAEFLDRKQRGRLRIGQRCCPAISKPRDQKRGNQFRSAVAMSRESIHRSWARAPLATTTISCPKVGTWLPIEFLGTFTFFVCVRRSEGIVFCFRFQGRQLLREGCRFFAG
jgi:hypothetical protein